MKLIKFLFILCIPVSGISQKPDTVILYDTFLYINYNKNEVTPAEMNMEVLDYIGNKFERKKIPEMFNFCLDVGNCIYEKENDKLIGYKRVEYLLTYLQKKYHTGRENFQLKFSNSALCESLQEKRISNIWFSLQKCSSIQNATNEISNRILKNIFYEPNEIIPNSEGKQIIYDLAESIKNDKILKNNRFLFEIITCKTEIENDNLIFYKRIDYLLDYFSAKYNIDSEKFQFKFVDSNLQGQKQMSSIKITINNCE